MKNNPQRNSVYRSAIVAALMLTTVDVSQAACSQADLTGAWYTTGVSGDSYYGEMAEWERCKIRLSSNGTVIASGSFCTYRDSSGRSTVKIGGGRLRITSACSLSGTVQLCASGVCLTETVEYGQLDKGKTVMSFVGYYNLDPDIIFSHTGIKQ